MSQPELFPERPSSKPSPERERIARIQNLSDGIDTRVRRWVVVHNDLVLARVDWDIHMYRIFAMLVSQISKEDEVFHRQRIKVRDLVDLAEIKREGIHGDLADAAQKLVREPIEFRTEDNHYEGYPIFAHCKYVRGEGCIEAKFNEDARPYLLQLNEYFTMWPLRYQMRLSTSYAVRFYQISKMIQRAREKRTQKFSIEHFRRMFKIEDKYSRHCDVHYNVIDPSVKEVNQKTDTRIECKTVRRGNSKYGAPIGLLWSVWPPEDPDRRLPDGRGASARPLEPRRSQERTVPTEGPLTKNGPAPAGLPASGEAEQADAFETWFEGLPAQRQKELRAKARRLVVDDGRNPDRPGFESFVYMKLRNITREQRAGGGSEETRAD
jgi:hypothetical protein